MLLPMVIKYLFYVNANIWQIFDEKYTYYYLFGFVWFLSQVSSHETDEPLVPSTLFLIVVVGSFSFLFHYRLITGIHVARD